MQRGTSSDRIDNESKVVSRIPRPPNNRSKSSSESRKIGTETTKKHENFAFERSEAFGVTLQTLGEARPAGPKSALGTARAVPRGSKSASGRVRGASACHPDDAGTQPKSVRNAKACSNSHSIGFSSFFGPSVGRPNLNFRQPAQCFVDLGRRTHRLPAGSEKVAPGHHFRAPNRLRGPSGRLGRAQNRPLRAIKSARSTFGVSAKFFCRCERGKKREKERMLGDVECGGPQCPGSSSENLRLDVWTCRAPPP